MFSVNLEQLLFIYVIAFFLVPGCFLLLQRWSENNTWNWNLSESRLARCRDCNTPFVVERQRPTSRCPQCNSVRITYPK